MCIRDAFYNVRLYHHRSLSKDNPSDSLRHLDTLRIAEITQTSFSAASREAQFTPQSSTYNGVGHQGNSSFFIGIPRSVVYSRKDRKIKRWRAEPFTNASHTPGIVFLTPKPAGYFEYCALLDILGVTRFQTYTWSRACGSM